MPQPSRSASRAIDSAPRPSASASSTAAVTMRSRLSPRERLDVLGSCHKISSARGSGSLICGQHKRVRTDCVCRTLYAYDIRNHGPARSGWPRLWRSSSRRSCCSRCRRTSPAAPGCPRRSRWHYPLLVAHVMFGSVAMVYGRRADLAAAAHPSPGSAPSHRARVRRRGDPGRGIRDGDRRRHAVRSAAGGQQCAVGARCGCGSPSTGSWRRGSGGSPTTAGTWSAAPRLRCRRSPTGSGHRCFSLRCSRCRTASLAVTRSTSLVRGRPGRVAGLDDSVGRRAVVADPQAESGRHRQFLSLSSYRRV